MVQRVEAQRVQKEKLYNINSFPGTTHITGVLRNRQGHLNYTCILNLPMVPVSFSS